MKDGSALAAPHARRNARLLDWLIAGAITAGGGDIVGTHAIGRAWGAGFAALPIAATAFSGQTPGKVLLGIAVVDERGGNPTFWASFGRWFTDAGNPIFGAIVWFCLKEWFRPDRGQNLALDLFAVFVFLFIMFVAGPLVIALYASNDSAMRQDPGHQGRHDRIARTWVVRVAATSPHSPEASVPFPGETGLGLDGGTEDASS